MYLGQRAKSPIGRSQAGDGGVGGGGGGGCVPRSQDLKKSGARCHLSFSKCNDSCPPMNADLFNFNALK